MAQPHQQQPWIESIAISVGTIVESWCERLLSHAQAILFNLAGILTHLPGRLVLCWAQAQSFRLNSKHSVVSALHQHPGFQPFYEEHLPACTCVCVCARPEFQNHLLYACFARFMRFLPTLPAKNINNQFSFMTFLVVREDFSKLVWVSEGVFQKCFKNQLGHGKPRKFAELSMRVSSLCQKRSNFYGQDNSEFPIAVRRVIWCLQIVTTLKNE